MISAINAESMHTGPAWVARAASGVGVARPGIAAVGCVPMPSVGRGVVTAGAAVEPSIEKVGISVASGVGVAGGGSVAVGTARAVCVRSIENCAWTVSAAAVKIAPTSGVGSGSCPKLQADRMNDSKSKLVNQKFFVYRIRYLHDMLLLDRREKLLSFFIITHLAH